jgi:hypothetical protein
MLTRFLKKYTLFEISTKLKLQNKYYDQTKKGGHFLLFPVTFVMPGFIIKT